MFYYEIGNYLMPYTIIDSNVQAVYNNFVAPFENNSSRYELFEAFNRFIEAVEKEITSTFVLWINGSFVTTKINPSDIDMVLFVPFAVYEAKKPLIQQKFSAFSIKEFTNFKIDAYIVPEYLENHLLYT